MTLTLRSAKGSELTHAELDANFQHVQDRANHTGTQAASTISDLTEVTQDMVGAMIVAGANVSVSYNDVAGTLTISASGGGITYVQDHEPVGATESETWWNQLTLQLKVYHNNEFEPVSPDGGHF